MQYQKLISGETIIEFHNNWLGEETVIVNGQTRSKKSSVWGTSHYFNVMENGRTARYILKSRVDANLQVKVDLTRNGNIVEEDVHIKFGSAIRKVKNEAKKKGLHKLKEYELESALKQFKKALKQDPGDPETLFHMACAYSVLEETKKGYESIRKAVKYGLNNREIILTHDMLAFLRIQSAFEGFLQSDFTKYNEDHFDRHKTLGSD